MEVGLGSAGVSAPPVNLNTPAAAENEAAGHVQRPGEERGEPVSVKQAEAAAAPGNSGDTRAAAGTGKGTQLDISV